VLFITHTSVVVNHHATNKPIGVGCSKFIVAANKSSNDQSRSVTLAIIAAGGRI
jgi:hypothetical protein